MRLVPIAGFCLFLTACGHAPVQINDRQDYLAEATRTYQKQGKERIIQAAETILKTSDPNKFDMRYTGGGFVGLRKYFIYAIIASASGQEKWEFNVEEKGDTQVAALTLSDAGITASGSSINRYEGSLNAIPLYRLFWKRMDYMLGNRPDWVTCNQEVELLRAADVNPISALSGLCGPTSAGRDAPAPEPLAKTSTRPASRS